MITQALSSSPCPTCGCELRESYQVIETDYVTGQQHRVFITCAGCRYRSDKCLDKHAAQVARAARESS